MLHSAINLTFNSNLICEENGDNFSSFSSFKMGLNKILHFNSYYEQMKKELNFNVSIHSEYFKKWGFLTFNSWKMGLIFISRIEKFPELSSPISFISVIKTYSPINPQFHTKNGLNL